MHLSMATRMLFRKGGWVGSNSSSPSSRSLTEDKTGYPIIKKYLLLTSPFSYCTYFAALHPFIANVSDLKHFCHKVYILNVAVEGNNPPST